MSQKRALGGQFALDTSQRCATPRIGPLPHAAWPCRLASRRLPPAVQRLRRHSPPWSPQFCARHAPSPARPRLGMSAKEIAERPLSGATGARAVRRERHRNQWYPKRLEPPFLCFEIAERGTAVILKDDRADSEQQLPHAGEVRFVQEI